MKKYLHAYAMCQSMFCSIPCPWRVWDPEARDKMLLFLPLIGLEIGGLWVLVWWLCGLLRLPAFVSGLLLTALPFLLTGFIHLDGFMDVTDAVRSCRDLARRREILKDSHVGSFAVIGCILLMLAHLALFSSAKMPGLPWVLIPVPMVSRCCSGLAITLLPPMSTSQYAGQKRPHGRIWVFLVLLAAGLTLSFLLWGRYGFVLVGEIAGYGLALFRGYHSLKGMNGDLSGYALTLSELCAVGVLVLL